MSWLSGETIQRIVLRHADEATRQAFHGVYSIDTLPTAIPHRPIFIVLNTHPQNLNGEHWKVIFIRKDKRAEVFDSLAQPLNIPTQQWLKKHTRQWKSNARAFQHPLSSTCGAFVLYFIFHRLRVRRFENVTKKFSCNLHSNEKIVRKFYNELK